EGEIGAADLLEGGHGIGLAVVPGAAELRLEQLEAPPRHVGHQRIAIAEVAIGGSRAYAGGARGLGEGEAGGALGGAEVEGGADQRLAQIAVVIAATLLVAVAAIPLPAHVNSSYMSPPNPAAYSRSLTIGCARPQWGGAGCLISGI